MSDRRGASIAGDSAPAWRMTSAATILKDFVRHLYAFANV